MITYLMQGIMLGFVAGVSPGPLLGLLIAETLRRGWRAGMLVALAPLFSDIPMLFLITLALGQLPPFVLPVLSIAGGLFIIYQGYDTVQNGRRDQIVLPVSLRKESGRVLVPAVAANLLNPHPYLFWASVGSAILLQGYASGGIVFPIAFLIGFYALLVGTKLVMALLLHWGRNWLQGKVYRAVLIGSGLTLFAFGGWLIWDGVQMIAF